jgi:thiol-disulfide isomerase/thioredoxin
MQTSNLRRFFRAAVRCAVSSAAVVSLGAFASTARGDDGEAKDFPPGVFTDGGHYDLHGLRGKVVVLFFFEESCPRCRGTIPERNKLVQSMKDKPVKFIAVDPGHGISDANIYQQETKLIMPVYPDPLRVMEGRWGEHISLQNVYQFKVIDAEGKLAALSLDQIPAVVAKASWKYKDKGYNPKLNAAIECFEWNQHAAGMKMLKPLLKDHNKTVADDAQKLLAEIKGEVEQWKADADKMVDDKPVEAYDLYAHVAAVFPADELGKSVEEPIKKLKTNKAVKDEMGARQMFEQVGGVMAKATPQQRAQVAQFCRSIVKKYPGTPTAEKASALADELAAGKAMIPAEEIPGARVASAQ